MRAPRRLLLVASGAAAAVLLAIVQPSAQTISFNPVGAALDKARQLLAPDARTTVFDVRAHVGGIVGGVTPGGPPPSDTGAVLSLQGEVHSAALKKELLALLAKELPYGFIDRIQALPHPDLGDKIRDCRTELALEFLALGPGVLDRVVK